MQEFSCRLLYPRLRFFDGSPTVTKIFVEKKIRRQITRYTTLLL